MRRVMVNGQLMEVPQARARAGAELALLREGFAGRTDAQVAELLEEFAARTGDVPEVADALYEAGTRWRAAGRPDRAAAAFGQLLTRFPLWPRALDAKRELGLAQIDQGREREGLQTLASVYDKLPAPQRPALALAAAQAAERAQLYAQAVRFRADTAALATGADRDRELDKGVEDLDQLPLADVARLRSEVAADSPLFPALLLKLARVRLHLRDEDGAAAEAKELAARFPGTPWAAEAQSLLDRLRRSTQVQPNVIGVAVPLSGKSKAWGEAILDGVQLALGDGRYRVVARDSRGDPEGAAEAIQQLVLQDEAIAIIGGVTNADGLRAAQAAQELEVPLISLSKVEKVTDVGPFVFRLMLTPEAQAKALVGWAMARKNMHRFAMMIPEMPYGTELADAFWDEVDARGGEITGVEQYEPDRTSFGPLVKDMVGKLYLDERPDYLDQAQAILKQERDPFRRHKALQKLREQLPPIVDFDAVFIPDFAKNVLLVAPALAVEDVVTDTCDPAELDRIRKATGREDLRPVQLLGANGWDDPRLVEPMERKYVECSVFVDGFYADSSRPETRHFVDAFQLRFGHPPAILEASAYDAARLLRHAVEQGARTRDAVRAALVAVRNFPGATGDIRFDERREVQKPLFFLTVEKGAVRELRPDELAGVAGER